MIEEIFLKTLPYVLQRINDFHGSEVHTEILDT